MGPVKGLDFTLQALRSHGGRGGEWRCGGRRRHGLACVGRMAYTEGSREADTGWEAFSVIRVRDDGDLTWDGKV